MKVILAFFAVLIILVFVTFQPIVNQINHYRMSTAQNIVHNAAQRARTDGYFTTTNLNRMVTELTTAFPNINPGDIDIVEATSVPKYRVDSFDQREMILYDIELPIDRILIMPGFFGLTEEQNKMTYAVKGEVASELLMP